MNNEAQLRCLKDYKYNKFLIVQKVSQINKDEKKKNDIISNFDAKEGIQMIKINGFEICCKNKNNLKQWASIFEPIFQNNEVIWIIILKVKEKIESFHLLV